MQISLLLVYLGVAAADALATWLPNFSRLGQLVSAAYRRRAPGPPGIVVAIPGYLLSGSSGHISIATPRPGVRDFLNFRCHRHLPCTQFLPRFCSASSA